MVKRLSVAALVALLVVASSGCQKDESRPPALDSVGPPFGGSSGGSGDGSADGAIVTCSSLSNDAVAVGERYVDVVVPTPLGGMITTGTYFLTQVNSYTGVGGNTGLTGRQFQETLLLDATTYNDVQAIIDPEAGAGNPVNTNGTYATSLTNFALSSTCPAAPVLNMTYTASAPTLHLFQGQEEFIYTAQ